MRKQLVSIIIVNHNGQKYLRNCLLSLQKVTDPEFELILVDNGSTDDSIRISKKIFPLIKLVKNKTNNGFALANNQGVDKAQGKYLLFLNNDTEVSPDFLKIIVDEMEKDVQLGVCQPKILLLDERKRIDAIGSYLTCTGFLYHYGFNKIDNKKYSSKLHIFSPRGACMLIRKKLFKQIGGFDKDYFAYFEETDLCWRVWLAGYTVEYIPTSVVYHSRGKTSSKMQSSFIQYHSFKNRICTLIKNLSAIRLIFILPIHLMLCFFAVIMYLFRRNASVSIAVLRALLWNIKNFAGSLSKRKIVQTKLRTLPDKKIWPYIYKSVKISYYYYLFIGLEKYQE